MTEKVWNMEIFCINFISWHCTQFDILASINDSAENKYKIREIVFWFKWICEFISTEETDYKNEEY